ncbi:MAG: hypothetical protein ACKOE2_08305, partial [Actinomycetales bacterium]
MRTSCGQPSTSSAIPQVAGRVCGARRSARVGATSKGGRGARANPSAVSVTIQPAEAMGLAGDGHHPTVRT